MARYLSIEDAQQAGFEIQHDAPHSQFTITKDGHEVGTAKYRLIGEQGIDFWSTVVDPSLRGTGLAGLLVNRAVSDDLVKERTVHASCWFVAGFLERKPEALAEGAQLAS